jgi:uncharacterized protein
LSTKISVKIQPNGGRNQVTGLANGVWKIKVAAPPEKGKANKELIEFLADTLDLRKDQIEIISGQTSHNKLLEIQGLDEAEILKRLGA